MIVNGFIEPITKTLPMEYAVELSPPHRAEHGGRGRLTPTATPPRRDRPTTHFTPDAARGARRPRLARRPPRSPRPSGSPTSPGRPRAEEIWRYSRIDELDLDRYRPVAPTSSGRPASSRRPGGGPFAAEAGERAGLVVVRNGRVVHHELDAGARGQGRARSAASRRATRPTCATRSASCSDASPDAFTVLHDAFLAGGAFVTCPTGVVVDRPDRGAALVRGRRPRQLPAHAASSPARRPRSRSSSRFGSPPTGDAPRRRRRRAARRRRRPRPLRLRAGARPAHLADRAPARAPRPRRDRCGRPRSRSAATTPGCAASRCLDGPGAESDLLAVYFGDGTQMLDFRTLQDHDAPQHPQRPAVQGRGRGRGPLGVLRARPPPARGAEGRGVPDEPQPRAHRGRRRGVDPEPRDRGQRRAVLAREHRRPDRRRPALLPREPRHPARGGRAAHRARLLRRRVRPPAGPRAGRAACAARVIEKIEHRGDR